MQDSLSALYNDGLQRNQPHVVEYVLKVTGAGTNRQLAYMNNPVILTGYAPAALTQTLVDAFLDEASTIPCSTCFDATSLGVDALGFVLNMGGQALVPVACEVTGQLGGTAIVDQMIEASQSALTSSLSSALAAADGNMYGRLVITGLDAATSGHIHMRVLYKAK